MADVNMSDSRGPNKRQRKPYDRPDRDRAPEGQWLHDRAPKAGEGGKDNSSSSASGGGRPARSHATSSDHEVSPKLVVSNLHYEVTDRDLSTSFGAYGTFAREPFIRYDRSGRSTGVGVVIFSTADEAARAKAQMQGIILKGEPIDIKYERFVDRPARKSEGGGRTSSDPSSLLNRIGKPPLKDRITKPDEDAPMDTAESSGTGPVRTAKSTRGANRGSGGGGGGGGRGGRPPREKKVAKTAEDLDKELDNYADTGAAAKPAAAAAGGDVEMAT